MPRKLDGTFIESNTVSVIQLTKDVNDKANAAYLQANTAYSQANAAFDAANSASGGFSKSFLLGGL
jgi:hypothetical protein